MQINLVIFSVLLLANIYIWFQKPEATPMQSININSEKMPETDSACAYTFTSIGWRSNDSVIVYINDRSFVMGGYEFRYMREGYKKKK